ncbi:MAG: DUF4129 domain-containing protein [Gemmatimonadales bacterium]
MIPRVPDDSLRAVLDSVFAGHAYDWAPRAPSAIGWMGDLWRRLVEWLEAFRTQSPTAFNWFYAGMILLLAAILVHGLVVLVRTMRAAHAPMGGSATVAAAVHDEAWYRRLAADLARSGRFPEAMLASFQAEVLALDRQRIVSFHPAKTPREYAREARLPPADRSAFEGLVRALYRYAFAAEPCDAAAYADWLQGLRRGWHAGPA